MAKVVYSAIMSLDGYIADTDGNFDWAEPDEEVHAFINYLEQGIGTYLLGRGMYEVMTAWEQDEMIEGMPAYIKEFAALWRAAGKIVFSRSLSEAAAKRMELRREFDPYAIRDLKASARRDISVGGPGLATHAFQAGLVDECHFFITPIIVGGGKHAFPSQVRVALETLEQRKFRNGTVYLAYRCKRG